MKIVFLILVCEYTVSIKMCKTSILRSLGFHSKLTPSAVNSLCPLITENCCTNHDLMKIHKTWNSGKEKYLQEYYDNSL